MVAASLAPRHHPHRRRIQMQRAVLLVRRDHLTHAAKAVAREKPLQLGQRAGQADVGLEAALGAQRHPRLGGVDFARVHVGDDRIAGPMVRFPGRAQRRPQLQAQAASTRKRNGAVAQVRRHRRRFGLRPAIGQHHINGRMRWIG